MKTIDFMAVVAGVILLLGIGSCSVNHMRTIDTMALEGVHHAE